MFKTLHLHGVRSVPGSDTAVERLVPADCDWEVFMRKVHLETQSLHA